MQSIPVAPHLEELPVLLSEVCGRACLQRRRQLSHAACCAAAPGLVQLVRHERRYERCCCAWAAALKHQIAEVLHAEEKQQATR